LKDPAYTRPFYIFLLMFPSGISNGFLTVVLPFVLSRNGFPLAVTAGIIAIGVSANLWRFLWGPVVDISLSIHKWFFMGVTACTLFLLLLCFIPFTVEGVFLLSVIVFISQVATTLTLLPINAIMAKRISEHEKGRVAGWYQAGHLAGTGIGGGAGLWIATHYNIKITGLVLGIASVLFSLTMLLIRDIQSNKESSIGSEIKILGKDIFAMIKTPASLLVMLLMIIPIGTGAMANLWSGLAQDWKTGADTVVLVTGLLSGVVSALGSVIGGFIADRWGVWIAYLGCAIICAIITLITAFMPFEPVPYVIAVLTYALTMGMVYSGFTAVILFAIGKQHVTTKYSLLVSLGNLPAVYMTAFNGWVHDKFGSQYMLIAEAVIGFLFVFIFTVLLKYMMNRRLIPATVPGR
jgi:MFS transporter, PAT family, beta-lactamase induction signal transducer AmpG